ncbi:MAG: PAS domain S-box protein [Chloroflexi bacterium]|nr:PAS domain S-box protein [Chloroflexota bacterium]
MPDPLRILILSRHLRDVEPVLRQSGFDPMCKWIETESNFLAELHPDVDVVLADCGLESLSASRALALAQGRSLNIPFILTAEAISAESVVDLIRQGAVDFVSMIHLDRLGQAVTRALKEKARRTSEREALKSSQDFARNLVDSSLDMIIAVDRKRNIVEFNRAAEETFGYRREEVLGKNVDMLYADPPSGLIVSQATFAQGRLVREVYNRRKNGERFASYLAASVVTDAHGSQIGLMGISRDISAMKQVEQQVEKRANEFSALYETTRDLATEYHLPTLLQTIVERATSLLFASGGGIYLFDPEATDLRFEAGRGEKNPPLGTRLRLGEGTAGRVAETRQPIIVDAPPRGDVHSSLKAQSAAVAVQVPMLYAGELIGVLAVSEFNSATHQFTQDDTRLLELFAAHAASAVHNATLFEQVRTSRERLQKLSGSLLRAQELERRSIARELHDEIGQALTGIQLNFQSIEPLLRDRTPSALLSDNMATIEHLLHQVRDLSLNLRPSILDDFGLVPALRWLLKRQPFGTGLAVDLITADIEPRPAAEVETVCFRVTQEALTNTVRHAKASRMRIELSLHEQELWLSIDDDGVGFDVPDAMKRSIRGSSMGLLGMHERVELVGGRIGITSAEGLGTKIRVAIPLRVPEAYVERRARRRNVP